MDADFRNGGEVLLWIRVLTDEQNIPSEGARDAEFVRHVWIQARQIDNNVCG